MHHRKLVRASSVVRVQIIDNGEILVRKMRCWIGVSLSLGGVGQTLMFVMLVPINTSLLSGREKTKAKELNRDIQQLLCPLWLCFSSMSNRH